MITSTNELARAEPMRPQPFQHFRGWSGAPSGCLALYPILPLGSALASIGRHGPCGMFWILALRSGEPCFGYTAPFNPLAQSSLCPAAPLAARGGLWHLADLFWSILSSPLVDVERGCSRSAGLMSQRACPVLWLSSRRSWTTTRRSVRSAAGVLC